MSDALFLLTQKTNGKTSIRSLLHRLSFSLNTNKWFYVGKAPRQKDGDPTGAAGPSGFCRPLREQLRLHRETGASHLLTQQPDLWGQWINRCCKLPYPYPISIPGVSPPHVLMAVNTHLMAAMTALVDRAAIELKSDMIGDEKNEPSTTFGSDGRGPRAQRRRYICRNLYASHNIVKLSL